MSLTCVRACASAGNAIRAFGNGTDMAVWPPMSPAQVTTTTTSTTTVTSPHQRNRNNNVDNHINSDSGIYHFCGSLQVPVRPSVLACV